MFRRRPVPLPWAGIIDLCMTARLLAPPPLGGGWLSTFDWPWLLLSHIRSLGGAISGGGRTIGDGDMQCVRKKKPTVQSDVDYCWLLITLLRMSLVSIVFSLAYYIPREMFQRCGMSQPPRTQAST